jgi:hypothetical protein
MANTQESCGFNGMCDGSGVCEFWPVTTVCVQQTCNGSTYYPADYCSGEGQCLEGGSMSCCPYKCWVSKCLTSCATSADCCDGATCVASVCIAGP